VVEGVPADDAGLEGGDDRRFFQGQRIDTGGDVIVAVDGKRLEHESDLAELVARRRPGETVTLEILREGDTQEIEVELEQRPARVSRN
jgi:S1-C subfamily serine protease